jgi:hypothetical protein
MKTSYNKNLEGQFFGKLTALKNLGAPGKYRYDRWSCLCNCGKVIITSSYNLLTGRSKSCGMNHAEDLVGKNFGKLTVIKENHKNKNGERYWLCQCTCGKFRTVRTFRLLNGSVFDCYKCVPHYIYEDRTVPVKKSLFLLYQRRAKRKNQIFSLTFEHFVNLISSNCYYCGSSPSNTRRTNFQFKNISQFTYNGIDRVDNIQGYLQNNCVSCCFNCNSAKAILPLQNFIEWGLTLHENLCRGLKPFCFNEIGPQKKFREYILKSYKQDAIKRGLSFSLTRDEFFYLLNHSCYYCGGMRVGTRSGIDRVDNSLGYTRKNSVPCCKICNRAKLAMPLLDFISWGLKLGENLKNCDNKLF